MAIVRRYEQADYYYYYYYLLRVQFSDSLRVRLSLRNLCFSVSYGNCKKWQKKFASGRNVERFQHNNGIRFDEVWRALEKDGNIRNAYNAIRSRSGNNFLFFSCTTLPIQLSGDIRIIRTNFGWSAKTAKKDFWSWIIILRKNQAIRFTFGSFCAKDLRY